MPPRFAAVLAAAALLGLGAPFVAACAESERLLPAAGASALDDDLQRVADATAAGDCEEATAALRAAQEAFADLPRSLDRQLRERLGEGLAQLARTVPDQCREGGTTTTTTTTDTATTEPPTSTTTTEPTTTTTTTTTTAPTTTTTTAPTTPPTEDPGGISPEGQGDAPAPDGAGGAP